LRIDSNGVSSAIVTLNGVVIFKENDFNANVALLTRPVTLQATNQLTVELRGKVGESLTLQLIGVDNTPPTMTASGSRTANAAGCTGSDTLSGIASCSAPVTLSNEGRNQSASGTCTDNAGNVSAAASVAGINIDMTPPTLTFGMPAPIANAAGWNNANVTIGF